MMQAWVLKATVGAAGTEVKLVALHCSRNQRDKKLRKMNHNMTPNGSDFRGRKTTSHRIDVPKSIADAVGCIKQSRTCQGQNTELVFSLIRIGRHVPKIDRLKTSWWDRVE